MGIAGKFFTLANQITLIRMSFVVPVWLLLLWPNSTTSFIAASFFAVASATDWLDGYVARTQNTVSSFGKFLDPLADKVLVCSALIVLVSLQRVPSWIVIVIVIRELSVTGLRAMAIDEQIVLAADMFGKIKTVLQIFAITPLLLHYPRWGIDMVFVGTFFLYIAMIVTVLSGAHYFYSFFSSWTKKGSGR